MSSSEEMIEILDKFIEENLREPGQCNSVKFRNALKELNQSLFNLHYSYLVLVDFKMFTMLKRTLYIMGYIQHSDTLDALHSAVYIDCMQLGCFITSLKFVICKKFPLGDEIGGISLKSYSIEQNIAKACQSKLTEHFLTIKNKNELAESVQAVSLFMIDYIVYLEIIKENELLKQNFKLLLEIGDAKYLFENINDYLLVIPLEFQLDFIRKLAYYLNEASYDLNAYKPIMSPDKDTRSEACSLTYNTLKHLLKSFPHDNWSQTWKIFDHFPLKSILSVLEPDSTADDLCGEAVKLFIFPKHDTLMPLQMFDEKIDKYIDTLKCLASTSGDHELHNYRCPFALILLSTLYDFAVNSDLPCASLVPLVQLIIDYLKTCKLPPTLKAASIVFDVYQKAKSSDEFLVLVKPLCRAISKSFEPHIVPDLLEVLDNDDKMSDRLIITANFLYDRSGNSMIKNADLQPFLYTLNEKVIFLSHQWFANRQWVLPYCISLHISLLTGDEDRVHNNLAVLPSYLYILINSNQVTDLDDKKYFFNILIMHYIRIHELLPINFLLICWNNVVTPQSLGIKAFKMILVLCSPGNLQLFIRLLKQETMRVMDLQDGSIDNNYYSFLHRLWSCLLNKQYKRNFDNRGVLRSSVFDFVLALGHKYKFENKNLPTVKLMFIMKLLISMLKMHWVNKDAAINCSLQIITYVEHGSHITENVLTETARLLIYVYRCPVYEIKPYLGIYMISFAKMVKKCWALAMENKRLGILRGDDMNLLKPFYKLEKCSSLFKENREIFENVCQYLNRHMFEILVNMNLPPKFKECFYNIIYNLMDLCSENEMAELFNSVDHLEKQVLYINTYNSYKNNRFIGM